MNTYANRGQVLERFIELTNIQYERIGVYIQKIATPVKVLKNMPNGKVMGHWEKKSTVDFVGCCKGQYFCFDAKETSTLNLALDRIEPHQLAHMKAIYEGAGTSFIVVGFTKLDRYFVLDYIDIEKFNQREDRKSIPLAYFEQYGTEIKINDKGYILNYLAAYNL